MPHLTLEYSANVQPPDELESVFSEFHGLLHDHVGVSIGNCKSRARTAESFLVGEGRESDAFVHLEVRLLAGRSAQDKRKLGEDLLGLLRTVFSDADRQLDLQITVELVDMKRASYFKHPSGTIG